MFVSLSKSSTTIKSIKFLSVVTNFDNSSKIDKRYNHYITNSGIFPKVLITGELLSNNIISSLFFQDFESVIVDFSLFSSDILNNYSFLSCHEIRV